MRTLFAEARRTFWLVILALLLAGCGGGSGSDSSSSESSDTSGGGSSEAAVAAFSVSTTNPVTGRAVLFTDFSRGEPTAWLWEFGDGTTSHEQNTGHVYTATGSYSVKLTVTTSAGSFTAQAPVVVTQPEQGGAVGIAGVALEIAHGRGGLERP